MPPRRAAKAATVSGDAKAEGKKQPSKATKATKPASKPSAKPASKPAARSRATKRAAEAEDDDEHRDTSAAPPTKRRKAAAKGDNDVAEPQPKPKSTSRKVAKVGSNDTLVEEENIEKKGEKPKAEKFKLPKDHTFFNPLPSPPTHSRPAPVLFVWGAGNFGQFAMGEDHLGELEKPTRNKLIEQKIEEGAFGEEGAGLESVAAGGMYTLFVDEQGTVSIDDSPTDRQAHKACRYGPPALTTTPRWAASLRRFQTLKRRESSSTSTPSLPNLGRYSLLKTRASVRLALRQVIASLQRLVPTVNCVSGVHSE